MAGSAPAGPLPWRWPPTPSNRAAPLTIAAPIFLAVVTLAAEGIDCSRVAGDTDARTGMRVKAFATDGSDPRWSWPCLPAAMR